MAAHTRPGWQHFEHMADMGVRGVGRTPAEAFEYAALAMTAVITSPELVAAAEPVQVRCRGSDPELLLVDWLNALILLMADRRMLFARFEVRIEAGGLQGTAWGEAVNRQKHQPAVEIKGATYTQLAVRQTADGLWLAQCVVDV